MYGAYQKIMELLPGLAVEKLWVITASFFGGLISSRAMVFGNYSPFSVAFVAATPHGGTWAAIIGSVVGYMLPSAMYMPFRYIAAVFAVGAIKWAVSDLKKINTHPLYTPALSFLPLVTTGMTMVLINNSLPNMTAMYLAESFLGAGSAFFFSRSVYLLYNKRLRGVFSNTDIACFAITLSIFILAFNDIELYNVSLGRVIMVFVILMCGGVGGIAGGAISGVTIGAIAGLSSVGLSYISGAYGLGGLMTGIFSGVGKVYGVIAFIVAHGVASMQVGNESLALYGTIEVALATTAYLLVPKSQSISNIFAFKKENITGNALRNNIVLRLKHASTALSDVSGSVEEISEKLINSSKANVSQVFNKSAGEICAGCSMRGICWKKDRENSIKAFASLTPVLRAKGKVETNDFKPYLRERCGRMGEMRESVNKFYKHFLEKQAAEIRAQQVRDIAQEQFKITSVMLEDMADEFCMYQDFDEEAAERIENIFKAMDVYPVDVCCRKDGQRRMTVEVEIPKNRLKNINKARLTREISKACGKTFAMPCISNAEEKCKIQMCQKAVLDVKVAVSQESAGSFCGDSAVGFYDGQGRYIALISDGMGTGGMAAVDGTMACTMMESLLKAGIGYTTSLRLVNNALMSKSEEETLATMDIVALDLFTGKCDFRKAGATGTIVRRGKKTEYIENDSLPVGIMKEVQFANSHTYVKKGDIIVLLSDGATSTGTDWLIDIVENYLGEEPDVLAKDIVAQAKKNRKDGRRDDISALAIMVGGGEVE